jgi:hypothetical protein
MRKVLKSIIADRSRTQRGEGESLKPIVKDDEEKHKSRKHLKKIVACAFLPPHFECVIMFTTKGE